MESTPEILNTSNIEAGINILKARIAVLNRDLKETKDYLKRVEISDLLKELESRKNSALKQLEKGKLHLIELEKKLSDDHNKRLDNFKLLLGLGVILAILWYTEKK
jgi:hypothetical protein